MEALAKAVIYQNYSEADHGPLDRVAISIKGNVITLDVTATYKTALLGIAGVFSVNLPVRSEVTRSGSNLEVALVLDVTGSMKGSRIDSLKAAAKDFINTVIWDSQSRFYAKAAIVPYSMGVNVGALADTVRGVPVAGTCNLPGCQYYRFRNTFRSSRTFANSTCVSERIGSEAFTDVSPLIAPVGFNYPSPNNPCIPYEFIPLTANKTRLLAAIDALDGSGSTASQVGVAWGWYAVSRDFGIWSGESLPAAYGTPYVKKIVVIMTDGEFNSSYCNGVIAKTSTYGSGADEDKIDCVAPNGSAISQVGKLCEAMKAKGVTVYTIGFDIEQLEIVKQTLLGCASGPSNAFLAATSAELSSVFLEIGKRVTALRLSK